MIIIAKNDFTGFQEVARSIASDPKLQAYIDRYEKGYIMKILGVTLGERLIANLAGSPPAPTDTDLLAIFSAFDVQEQTGSANFVDGFIHHSLGLKDILVNMVFFHYVHESQGEIGQSGMAVGQSDASTVLTPRAAARFAERKWNASLESIESIQWYCRWFDPNKKLTDFQGQHIPAQYNSML